MRSRGPHQDLVFTHSPGKRSMQNDPTHPFGSHSGSTGGSYGFGADSVQLDGPPRNPGDDGYWRLLDGIWRWMTEPLTRTAVTT
jgi:hypothetical protein